MIPFLVGNLLLIPALTLDEAQLFDLFYGEIEVNNAAVFWVVVSIAFLHLGAIASIGSYLILAFRRLIQHRRSVLDQFSSIEHISLNWLRLLLIVLSVLYIVMLVDMFLSESLGLDETVNNVLYLLVVISIYAMGYMGLRQPLIFTNSNMDAASESKADSKEADVVQGAAKKKYEKSALDKETICQHKKALSRQRDYAKGSVGESGYIDELPIPSHQRAARQELFRFHQRISCGRS